MLFENRPDVRTRPRCSVIHIHSDQMHHILEETSAKLIEEVAVFKGKRLPFCLRRELSFAFLKYLLPEIPDVQISRQQSGQPFLVSKTQDIVLPHVSISHSGAWIGCALFDQNKPIGLDIEDLTILRSYEKIAACVFSKEENRHVVKEKSLGFYKIWTAKEAITKCHGCGVDMALQIDMGSQLLNTSYDVPVNVSIKGKTYEIIQSLFEDKLIYTTARLYG